MNYFLHPETLVRTPFILYIPRYFSSITTLFICLLRYKTCLRYTNKNLKFLFLIFIPHTHIISIFHFLEEISTIFQGEFFCSWQHMFFGTKDLMVFGKDIMTAELRFESLGKPYFIFITHKNFWNNKIVTCE